MVPAGRKPSGMPIPSQAVMPCVTWSFVAINFELIAGFRNESVNMKARKGSRWRTTVSRDPHAGAITALV